MLHEEPSIQEEKTNEDLLLSLSPEDFINIIPELKGIYFNSSRIATSDSPEAVIPQVQEKERLKEQKRFSVFYRILQCAAEAEGQEEAQKFAPSIINLVVFLTEHLQGNTALLSSLLARLEHVYAQDTMAIIQVASAEIKHMERKKGKGKGGSSSSSATIAPSLPLIKDILENLLILVRVFPNIACFGLFAFRTPRLDELCQMYKLNLSSSSSSPTTTLGTPAKAGGSSSDSFSSITNSLLFLYEAIGRIRISEEAKEIKRMMLQLVDLIFQHIYWKPIDECLLLSDDGQTEERVKIIDDLLNSLCDWALIVLDHTSSTSMDGHLQCLVDAPLLVDFDVYFGLEESLNEIISRCRSLQSVAVSSVSRTSLPDITSDASPFDQLDFSRVEFLNGAIGNLISYSGTTSARNQEREMRISRKKMDLNSSEDRTPLRQISAIEQPEQQDNDDYQLLLAISQVHDLFPDLGDGFIEKCLEEYIDAEGVIMKILENALPPHLDRLDRTLPSSRRQHTSTSQALVHFQSAQSLVREKSFESVATAVSDDLRESFAQIDIQPLPERRNIFDGDAFDVFRDGDPIDPSLVSVGKKEKTINYDAERADFIKEQKEAIIASQLPGTNEEDEYDDTYDLTDIKNAGKFDATPDEEGYSGRSVADHSSSQNQRENPNERYLIGMYNTNPSLFHPSSRGSRERLAIRNKLKWTDEQIEGFFIMLNRNPDKQAILDKYEWKGNHHQEEEEEVSESKPPKSKESPPSQQVQQPPPRGSPSIRKRGGFRSKRGQRMPDTRQSEN